MKTKCDKWQVTSDRLAAARGKKSRHPSPVTRQVFGFTLIELLVVISIMGVLAGLTIPALAKIKETQYKKVARGELEFIQGALENYKAKYGVYPPANKNGAGTYQSPLTNSMFSQLFYELSGVKHDTTAKSFTTLDGSATISEQNYAKAYGVGGIINCAQGGGEDATNAKNFLAELRSKTKQISTVSNNGVADTAMIVTSIGGPDSNYNPLGVAGMNPFRYLYPGVNNPNSYDLWVQLVIKGKTNLICNWTKQVQINTPFP